MEYVERHDLALHAWLSGQLLEPEHFERQERVLLAHMAARLRLTGLPVHGIVALELDEEQLDERVVAVMNAQFLGNWDVAPRSHPADGRLEVLDAQLSLSERMQARRRLPTGTHLPHPAIATRSVRAWQTDLDPGTEVWLDGVALGRARHLSVRVEPDSLVVVV